MEASVSAAGQRSHLGAKVLRLCSGQEHTAVFPATGTSKQQKLYTVDRNQKAERLIGSGPVSATHTQRHGSCKALHSSATSSPFFICLSFFLSLSTPRCSFGSALPFALLRTASAPLDTGSDLSLAASLITTAVLP